MNVTEEMVRECGESAGGFAGNLGFGWYVRFANELATRLREQWEEERLQPTPGPPDLEGVPDDAWILWSDGRDESIGINRVRWIKNCLSAIKWHIPLGPITPPEPELPKCPECSGEYLEPMQSSSGEWYSMCCSNCGWSDRSYQTEAEAIAACRKAGE